ncbi:guanylate kinase [Alicyclobacillus curvatus]|nr:guanylate kinase [Alicyclobacillus curvatus]
MYTLVAFQGPSGSGKTTLQYYLGLEKVVTSTTRSPRPGEVDGVDYHFVSQDDMNRMIDGGEMLEFTNYNGNIYGSALASVLHFDGAPRSIVLDSCGIQRVREELGERCLIVGVYAPEEDCRRRLAQRSTGDCEKRMSSYEAEVEFLLKCDVVINNSDMNAHRAKGIVDALRTQLLDTGCVAST